MAECGNVVYFQVLHLVDFYGFHVGQYTVRPMDWGYVKQMTLEFDQPPPVFAAVARKWQRRLCTSVQIRLQVMSFVIHVYCIYLNPPVGQMKLLPQKKHQNSRPFWAEFWYFWRSRYKSIQYIMYINVLNFSSVFRGLLDLSAWVSCQINFRQTISKNPCGPAVFWQILGRVLTRPGLQGSSNHHSTSYWSSCLHRDVMHSKSIAIINIYILYRGHYITNPNNSLL